MKQHVKNIVLVHGAFADGSGWEPVASILRRDGYKVSAGSWSLSRSPAKTHRRTPGRNGSSEVVQVAD
jgi:hypothetical protein